MFLSYWVHGPNVDQHNEAGQNGRHFAHDIFKRIFVN